MTTPVETLKDCAAEAEFQLLCAKSYAEWLVAWARGINLAHAQGKPDIGAGLTSLVDYLDSTRFGTLDEAISQFKELHDPAPQNATPKNRGAHGEVQQ